MSDSYIKDRARKHAFHKFTWLALLLAVAGTASLNFAWGDGHLGNVMGLWWAWFISWVGAPGTNTKIGETIAPAGMVLASLAADPGHPFWRSIVIHSRQLMAWLVASPILSATILFSFQSWKKSRGDEVEIKRGAEILDAKELTKRIKKGE